MGEAGAFGVGVGLCLGRIMQGEYTINVTENNDISTIEIHVVLRCLSDS